ncbi:Ankyrin-2 [Araneus ventricosus]|uniref:Alpha-latrotoxin n=1 Tax=Araneus ventricosus TaxID=182803 RepID=A0A4Y2R027_ARAVE|nr:Ankyrin-2 [Araneus ventricosus]
MNKDKSSQINDQLLIAISENDMNKVKELLKSGADVNVESTVNQGSTSKYGYKPYTPLILAAEEGYLKIVQELLRSPGIDVNRKNYYGNVALHMASARGHVEVVKTLLAAKDIDANLVDKKYEFSPLITASKGNQAEVVKILLNTPEVEINKTDAGGKSALHQAASSGHEETVQILLKDRRISVNLKDSLHGHTALHLATDFHHNEVVRALLNHPDIDVNVEDMYGQTALHTSAYHGNVKVVEMLLESGIDVNIKTKNGSTAVYLAGKQKNATIVKIITEHIQLRKVLRSRQRVKSIQVSEDSIGYYEILPVNEELLEAAQSGDSEKVNYLMKQPGIEVNTVDRNGNTPLHLAAEKGHAGVVKIFLESEDINVNAKNLDKSKLVYPVHSGDDAARKKLTNGKAALHLAVKNGHFEVVKLLINHIEIDVNTMDKYGQSCLQLAVSNNFTEIGKLLLNHIKIDPNVQYPCNDYYTALHTAIECRNMEIIGALINHPDIDLNIKERYKGLTPFHMVVEEGNLPVVEIMLQHPATNVNTVDKYIQTPLYTCVKKGNVNMVELLLKAGVKVEEDVLKISTFDSSGTKSNPAIVQMIKDYIRGNIKVSGKGLLSANEGLLAAAQNGDSQRVQELLKQSGIDVNYVDTNGNTCLHLAAERGYVEIVRELLKRLDIEVNIKNRDDSKYIYPIHFGDDPARSEITVGKTPLFCAVMRGHLEVVKLILNHYKIEVNSKDKYDKSCLYLAAVKGYKTIVQALLRHPKIDVNAKYICHDHFTPLHIAVEKNQMEIVAALLSHPNINVNIKNRLFEHTPLHTAANHGYVDILELILTHPKINVNVKDKSGRTALQVAMHNKHESCVQVLLNTRLPA